MAKKFNLGDYLKDAAPMSESDTEQITRVPLESIDPDPNNFYSLEGLGELAANIETVGLLDPLRVRPSGERYTIVSGHRRRAALQLLRDSGCERWRDGVPCIIELGEASDAMRELRLIFANSSTRVMSPADLSKQAERVTQLLYELKEQGVEFPGSMRAHVAEACKVSQSKLARLHAIRGKLVTELLQRFDRGEVPEETAYQLSRLPEDLQQAVAAELEEGRRKALPRAWTVEEVIKRLGDLQAPISCRAHAGGPDCHNVTQRIVRSVWAPGSWDICDGKRCCMDCPGKGSCSGACREAKDRAKLEAAEAKEKKAEEERRAEQARDAKLLGIRARCRELLPLIEAAGLEDGEKIFDSYMAAKAGEVRDWAEGRFDGKGWYSAEAVQPSRVEELRSMASKLGVSMGRLLGEEPTNSVMPPKRSETMSESDTPDPTAPVWEPGTPFSRGWYVCWAQWVGSRVPWDPDYELLYWGGRGWAETVDDEPDEDYVVTAWSRIPPPIRKEKEAEA